MPLNKPTTPSGKRHMTIEASRSSPVAGAAATTTKVHTRRRTKRNTSKRAKNSGRTSQRPPSRVDTTSEYVTVAQLACQASSASATSTSPNIQRRRYTGANIKAFNSTPNGDKEWPLGETIALANSMNKSSKE